MKTIAFGIVIFPSSWRFGVWRREKKDIFSVGPIRFVLYKNPGRWKPAGRRYWRHRGRRAVPRLVPAALRNIAQGRKVSGAV